MLAYTSTWFKAPFFQSAPAPTTNFSKVKYTASKTLSQLNEIITEIAKKIITFTGMQKNSSVGLMEVAIGSATIATCMIACYCAFRTLSLDASPMDLSDQNFKFFHDDSIKQGLCPSLDRILKKFPFANIRYGSTWSSKNLSDRLFVNRVLNKDQCPSLDLILDEQRITGIWKWNKDNLFTWFGNDRDLSLVEARLNLYKDLKNCIPALTEIMIKEDGRLGKDSARAISEFRDLARDYARKRSWEFADKYLSWFESRNDRGFEYYWKKYNQNPIKVIENAQESNKKYDSLESLEAMDNLIRKMNNLKAKAAYAFKLLKMI